MSALNVAVLTVHPAIEKFSALASSTAFDNLTLNLVSVIALT
ncbi:hypothetical protein [Clostridium muellerianum]|nr:hypothetical protein [Clostridium muellerianum]